MALGLLSCLLHLSRVVHVYGILCCFFLHGYGHALRLLAIDTHVLVDSKHHALAGST